MPALVKLLYFYLFWQHSMACGILDPKTRDQTQGFDLPLPLQGKCGALNTGSAGNSLVLHCFEGQRNWGLN